MEEAIQAQMRESMSSMSAINSDDILYDVRPLLVVYKDGRVQRFTGSNWYVPACFDPLTGVESKDVVVSPETGVFLRLYKPSGLNPSQKVKVPLLVYFHGGGFCIESTTSPLYQTYLNSLSSKADVIIASVEYRLAPEFPLPAAYDDCWSAIEFLAGKSDPWLREYADYSRVFFAGDSAGGNITYNMAKLIKKNPLQNLKLEGVLLMQPYFWGEDSEEGFGSESLPSKVWTFVCPGTSGWDDPRINPDKDPEVGELGGERVLVSVAEKDSLRDRGVLYKETLEKSGWNGTVEVVETPGEDHVFHLMKPSSAAAAELMDKVVDFINRH